MRFLTAGLAATGMDWLLRSHPALHKRPTFQWWILPTLTTFVVGVLYLFAAWRCLVDRLCHWRCLDLLRLPGRVHRGGCRCSLLFPGHGRADSYFLYSVLYPGSGSALQRDSPIHPAPALFLASGLASLRTLHLRFSGRWEYAWAAGIAFVCVQLAAGLHTGQIFPIQFGLMLVGPLYGLTNLAANLGEDQPARCAAISRLWQLALCWAWQSLSARMLPQLIVTQDQYDDMPIAVAWNMHLSKRVDCWPGRTGGWRK